MKNFLLLILYVFAPFFVISQSITVINPNGGEELTGCNLYTISWSESNTSGQFNVEYTLDGGTNWVSLTSFYIGTSYSWSLPCSYSNTASVKIYDSNDNTIVDQSDTYFTINPPLITITSPNGGEQVNNCENYNISWISTGTLSNYNVDYSTDGGVNWISIASYFQGTSIQWTVQSQFSSTCLIRVQDATNILISDVSDNFFSIVNSIYIVTPNGLDQWIALTNKQIYYTTAPSVNTVDIDVSTNGGVSWTEIADSHIGGAFTWEVWNQPSEVCLVRVRDHSNSCKTDVSDTLFTILSSVDLQTVNGGEQLQAEVAIPFSPAVYNMDNVPVITDGGRFYDSGGPTGNYGPNENYTKFFYPETPGNKLRLTSTDLNLHDWNGGSSHSGTIYDNIRICNADGSNCQTLIYSHNHDSYNQNNRVFTSTDASGGVQIRFQSNQTYGNSGFAFNIESLNQPVTTVDWNIVGTSKYFDLSYSVDNGSTWIPIMDNYYSPAGTYDWNVPNNPSTTCLFKVTDRNNTQIYNISDNTFEIIEKSPYISWCQPYSYSFNTQENTTKLFNWSSFGAGPFSLIEYSYDSAATWHAVDVTATTNFTQNSYACTGPYDGVYGSYSWSVPNTPSTNCFIRITDTTNTSITTTSDRFTISSQQPAIYNVYTNVFTGCDNAYFYWTANQNAITGPMSGDYNILISVDSGATYTPIWNNITRGISGFQSYGSYQIPNISRANVFIRVEDAQDTSKYDISPRYTFTPTTDVTLVTPNNGEQWIALTNKQIHYTTAPSVNTVDIDVSTNGGVSWTEIADSHIGGAFTWEVWNQPSEVCLVRVRDHSNSCKTDVSDTLFTILSSVDLQTVNGGEQLQAEVAIPFSPAVYNMDNVPVITDGGRFYDSGGPTGNYGPNENYTKFFYPETPGNKLRLTSTDLNLHDWNGGSSHSGTIYDNIRICNADGSNCQTLIYSHNHDSYNQNNRVFTSTDASGGVQIRFQSNQTYGNSGFAFNIESLNQPVTTVDWNIVGTSKYFDLSYSVDNGSTWIPIMDNYYSPAGTYDWNVPNNPSTTCLFKVTDRNNTQIYNISDNTFEIIEAPSVLEVITPNAQNLYSLSNFDISWQSEFLSGPFVDIEYSFDGGNIWNIIAIQEDNDGVYSWDVPSTYSNLCYVRITDHTNVIIYDLNDLLFTISPPIKVTSPNGGNSQDYRGCTISSISWDAGGTSNYYNIFYSIDNGLSWIAIEQNLYRTNTTYNWLVPNTPTNQALIKIEDAQDNSKYDISDGTFIISPTIELMTFNYSGIFEGSSTHEILWNDTLTSNYYEISYSNNNGVNWTVIESSYYSLSGSYFWTLPSIISSDCKIKVEDANNICKTSSTEVPFTITSNNLYIDITSQENLEIYSGCDSVYLSWTDVNPNSTFTYNIEYSVDGGLSWTAIVNNYSQALNYYWVTPNINADKCLFAVRDVTNTDNYSVTRSHFKIVKSVTSEILFSRENLNLCVGDTIILTSSETSGNLWSTGETSQSIVVTSSGNYSLQVSQNGCVSNSDQFYIYFNQLPLSPTISSSGPTVFCHGSTVELNSNVPTFSNFWWNNGSTNEDLNVYYSGTYWLTLNVGGCIVTSNQISITVNDNPDSPIIYSNSPINYSSNLNLYSDFYSNTSYHWSGPLLFNSNLQNPTIQNVNLSNSGVYSLVLEENNCFSDPAYLSVTVLNNNINLITVSGSFYDENSNLIDNVDLLVDSTNVLNTINGFYQTDLTENISHSLIPSKNNDSIVTNGISTLDILLIQNHILGNNALSTPYKLIAADVNNSTTITTLDLLFIQQLILQVSSSYPSSDLWRFYNSDFIFPNPQFPYNSPQHRIVSSNSNLFNQDFVGIKLGDVNNSWNPNIAKNINNGELTFLYEDVKKGVQEVPIYSSNFNDIRSFQFTLDFDSENVEVLDIYSDFNISFNDEYSSTGKIPLLFYDESGNGISINDTTPIFYLKLSANEDFELMINSSLTKKEAINDKYSELDINIYKRLSSCDKPLLYPNPFLNELMIDISNSNFATPYSVSIYSVDGKEVISQIVNEQFFRFKNAHLNRLINGIYFVRISDENCTKVIKVIKD